MRIKKWTCLIFILYALSLSGCGKQEIADAEESDQTQNAEQLGEVEAEENDQTQSAEQSEEVAAVEQETWWSDGDWGHGSLSMDETADFLKQYGFDDQEPFYVYRSEEGMLLELYYDTETHIGCGIRYDDAEKQSELYGFAFCKSGKTEWEYLNPFSVEALYDNGAFDKTETLPLWGWNHSGNLRVSDYEEEYEYNEQGQLVSYCFSGMVGAENAVKEKEDILRIDFLYRPDGTLCEKRYSHNTTLLGESYSEQRHFYDEQERLLYTVFARPRSLQYEVFYLYEGDSSVPAYRLSLDEFAVYYVSFGQYVESSEDWKWISHVPVDGKKVFLRQIGFGDGEDVFYEYELPREDGESGWKITLYYNEEEQFGCGFCGGEDSKWCSAFVFYGVTTIDINETDPYAVVAYGFTDGRSIGQLPVEELQEVFGSDSLYTCDYEDGRLMHIYMYATHGSNSRYYIYGDSDTPLYCINLDPGWCVTMFQFIQ